jgi:hypothetical protein
MGDRHHRAPHPRRQAVLCRGAGCLLASGGRLVDRRHPDRSPGDQRPRHGDRVPPAGCGNADPLRPGGAIHLVGVQPARQGVRVPALHGWRRRLLRQRHDLGRSGPACRSSCWTAAAGEPASSSPTPSSTTWRSSITASAATAPWACSARSSSRPANPPPWHEESSSPTPRNRGQTRASRKHGAVHCWSGAVLWAWLDLNQRPYPYQRSTAERRAMTHLRRSRRSVNATRMR